MSDVPGVTSPRRTIGLWDAISIIIGVVIGAGIYETVPLVLQNTSGPAAALGVWALGGLLSLAGAACYGELASAYPKSGGDYVYLTRAFGPAAGFFFGWAQLVIILTGSIGMMAYVFADYASALFGVNGAVATALACVAVTALTLVNVASTSVGSRTQNVLSWLKVGGLGMIAVAGLVAAVSRSGAVLPPTSQGGGASGGIGLAMIFVLYTYGGWNDAAFVASEVREPKRNMPKALLLGTAAITLIYLIVNAAILGGLGFQAASTSQAVASDLLGSVVGRPGSIIISVIVMISALGAVNGLIMTGSRVHASVGAEHSALAPLGRWNDKLGSPVTALLAQLGVTLVLIAVVGTSIGRGAVDGALVRVGFAPAQWSGHGGFDTLLRCSAPVFWFFFLLTSLAVFVLRVKDPARPRPFRVPLYPIVPLLFTATCLFMTYSAIDYAGPLTAVGVAPVLLGFLVYVVSRRARGGVRSILRERRVSAG